MTVLEKDANDELKAVEKARRAEEERMTQQEKLYQVNYSAHLVHSTFRDYC